MGRDQREIQQLQTWIARLEDPLWAFNCPGTAEGLRHAFLKGYRDRLADLLGADGDTDACGGDEARVLALTAEKHCLEARIDEISDELFLIAERNGAFVRRQHSNPA